MEEIDYNDLVNCTSTLNVIGNSQELDREVKDGRSKGNSFSVGIICQLQLVD